MSRVLYIRRESPSNNEGLIVMCPPWAFGAIGFLWVGAGGECKSATVKRGCAQPAGDKAAPQAADKSYHLRFVAVGK